VGGVLFCQLPELVKLLVFCESPPTHTMSAADAGNAPVASRAEINSATTRHTVAKIEDMRDVGCMAMALFQSSRTHARQRLPPPVSTTI
jgi:2-methylaconitate cis-trans-isomerase PrpF